MKLPVIEAYLFLGGRCEEAVAFYQKALGAKLVMMMRYKDAPEQPPAGMLPPDYENKIMHASFQFGDTMVLASDGCGETGKPQGFSLSIGVATEAEADRYFHALANGGTVTMPLGKTFWSPRFGMLTDKFGIGWMVNVAAPGQP